MRRTIAGSRAVVTGASGGIGRAIALELGRRGAHVLGVARRAELLDALASEFASLPGRFISVAGDITESPARRQCIEQAVAAFGGLDLLVNNAGIGALGTFRRATPERLRRIMEVNFFAAVELIRDALPVLAQGRRPMIVQVASILGHRGIPNCTEYCASKFALRGFSQSLRAELSPDGIDVLVVSPGSTETEFFEHALECNARPAWRRNRAASPESVARATVRAIARGKHEIVPDLPGRLLTWLQRLSPRLADSLVARFGL
jgi:short-subunit dehydrogenase